MAVAQLLTALTQEFVQVLVLKPGRILLQGDIASCSWLHCLQIQTTAIAGALQHKLPSHPLFLDVQICKTCTLLLLRNAFAFGAVFGRVSCSNACCFVAALESDRCLQRCVLRSVSLQKCRTLHCARFICTSSIIADKSQASKPTRGFESFVAVQCVCGSVSRPSTQHWPELRTASP